MKFIHFKYLIFGIITVAIGCVSCSDSMHSSYEGFTEGGPIDYPAIPNTDSIKVYPGKHRVQISFPLPSDPSVSKARVYWRNGSDSLEVPIDKTAEDGMVDIMLTDMEGGSYTFDIYTYDDQGNKSINVTAIGEVYGDSYANSLLPRLLIEARIVDDTLTIQWSDAEEEVVSTEISYTNASGVSKLQYVPPEENISMMADYDYEAVKTIQHRTMYKPDSMAIDTFYTSYQTEEVLGPMPEVVFVTDDSNDNEQIEWLREQGFYVTTYYNSSFGSAPQEDVDMLNAADLVIIGRSGSSSDFDDDEKTAWNALTVPLILNSQWAARDNRMNWFNNDGNPDRYDPDATEIVHAQIQKPCDVAFEGVTLDGDLLPWLNTPVNLLYVDSTTPTNGEVLAVGAPGNAESEEGGGMLFVRFEPGTEFYTGAGDMPTGHRTYFGFGADTDASYYWQLTDETKQVYLNEIKRMLELGE